MKKTMLALGALSLTLAGCGAPEPVVLPDDAIDAARTCFVAKGLVLREGKGQGDPVTFEEFAESMKYPLAATAEIEPFSTDNVSKAFSNIDPVTDTISGQDYAGAIASCDARFGIDDTATLPENDADAALGCLTLAAFMQGASQSASAEFGAEGNKVGPLFERLQAKMESDPDILVKLIEDAQGAMNDATKAAFAEGAPLDYLEKCYARFPAE